jgi:eukaryotic-like serine/threonine-protein kinase
MESSQVDELKEHRLIGHGGCGRNYHAREEGAGDLVVKVFENSAISRPLLQKMTERLSVGGWPQGVMPLMAFEFAGEGAFWITPLVGDVDATGAITPQNLQFRLDEHPGLDTWNIVKSLAAALARMHERQVAHGNLKPENVFLSEDSGVLLSDWTMGNMPGVAKFVFTDAILYQPPEQLRDNVGYLDEKGYRWDVFAFGVLSFRLLTGKFPRCEETFCKVAPPAREHCKEGITADLTKVAKNLERQVEVTWPSDAVNSLEVSYRQWIERCLALDPAQRPATMIEVASAFTLFVERAQHEAEKSLFMDQRRRAEHRAWRATFFAGSSAAAALLVAAFWYQSDLEMRRKLAEPPPAPMAPLAVAPPSNEALLAEKKAAQALENERAAREQATKAELEASRLIEDRLFTWSMDEGNRRLPPIDGRETRLKQLDEYFSDFLTRTQAQPSMLLERARVRLKLAEISLSSGDVALARQRLEDAKNDWQTLPRNSEITFRLAGNSLLLALLLQSNGEADAGLSFIAARKALSEVPQAEVSSDRLTQLLAILDFHEAQLLAARGNESEAVEQLMRATQALNRIADQRPDSAVLRSQLAACYLSSASIVEGMGSLGDAREVRALAAGELQKLLKSDPQNFTLRLDLAGCYCAMAEAAALAGDFLAAESLSAEALKLLDRLVDEQPDHPAAVARKAAQLGLRAGIHRDRGQAADAMKGYDEAIRSLLGLHAAAPENALVSYRLALLWWQQGRMLGMSGKRSEEIALIQKAADLLKSLQSHRSVDGPSSEQVQSSGAYLLGDLGHAQQLAQENEAAARSFTEATALWESLLKSRPKSEEYSEGHSWCRQRLADLK